MVINAFIQLGYRPTTEYLVAFERATLRCSHIDVRALAQAINGMGRVKQE